jgi:methionine-rich copper-binding protein CopC
MDRARIVVIGCIIAACSFVTWPAASLATAQSALGPPVHFELRASAPQADSTVTPTDEVRLWFTQEPQSGTTQIRVMRGNERVPTGAARMDPEDATSFVVRYDMPFEPGEYRVFWRSMAPDGHVVDGEFAFRIAEAGAGR